MPERTIMSVRVLFFGHLVDITGTAECALPLAAGNTVADLLSAVFEQWPGLRVHDASLLVAVNQEFATRAEPVPAGAELAIMPPVQGG
jgi:molybdopterin synthase sulfur carrier subunit